jgi:predicted RND superfamily exporter protein
MVSEMDAAFDNEYLMITLITAFAVFFVVLIAFRNPTLPLILTLIVQCGVFITVAVTGAYSGSIYYLALLIVQSILMGATIDYGIVFCNFYKESRKMMPVPDALKAAYEASIHTIMTSSTMLIFALAAIGIFVKSAIISEVCITLAIGVLVAVILILFILPGMVACCDRLLGKRKETQIK